ncbi:PAS domain-containing protein [Zobellella sp. An-6]|uniref:PAS domain-containing protein n=1 Tax=Zobellella sp. An-6 TaxID=3400218 RepID=UPI004042FFA0
MQQPHQGRRITWPADKLIVSKTDLKGNITYANRTFMAVSDYKEPQLRNRPHNLIRHPDMPGGVFKLLWQTLQQGQEFFGFVKNSTANGDYYWVYANITPSFDLDGRKNGYFSVRRHAPEPAIAVIAPLYRRLRTLEQGLARREAAEASYQALCDYLQRQELDYPTWVNGLYRNNLEKADAC